MTLSSLLFVFLYEQILFAIHLFFGGFVAHVLTDKEPASVDG